MSVSGETLNVRSEIMLRASSGAADPLMLTITDGRGSYQGKIAAGPAGSGLILYRMQKPCATITADAPGPKEWKGMERIGKGWKNAAPKSKACKEKVVQSHSCETVSGSVSFLGLWDCC